MSGWDIRAALRELPSWRFYHQSVRVNPVENSDANVRPPFLVFVRDRNGWPIPGAKINFAVNGQDGFEVSNTEGRGSITGIRRSDRLLVRATYEGRTEEARPAPDTDQYTFRFDVDVAPIAEVGSRQQIPGWFPIA